MSCGQPPPKRVQLLKEEFEHLSHEDIAEKWKCQEQYIDWLESRCQETAESSELAGLRESEEKLKQQQLEATRRENVLVMRLTTKEHEMQEYANQIQELKQAQAPTMTQLRSTLLDPAINLLYERMRKEHENLKARLEETRNELSAWKFTPDSNTGKRLMAKCRLLYQENEELGKVIASGRMAKLEGDLALQRNFSEEMKKSQADLDEFLLELDEDVEGMQSTICYLQQQLREAKDQIIKLSQEKHQLSSLRTSQAHHANDTREPRRLSSSHHQTSKVVSATHNLSSLNKLSSDAETAVKEKSKEKFGIAVKEEQPNGYINDEHVADVLDFTQNCLKSRSASPVPKPEPFDMEDPHSPVDYAAELVVDKTESLISLELHPSEMHLDSPDANNEAGDLSVSVSLTPSHLVASAEDSQDAEFPSVVSDSYASSCDEEKLEKELPPTVTNGKRTSNSASTENEDSSSDKADRRKRCRTMSAAHFPSEEDDTYPSPKQPRTREDSRTATQASDHTYDSSSQDLHLHSPSIDVDTDTEVQVAQTLACWAAASKERNETHLQTVEESSLGMGNGEVDSCSDHHS